MPASCETALQQRCQQIVTSPVLTPEQKRHFLALEAENALPYPPLPEDARQALDEGVICDMFEGHAPFKPRYVLPDYARLRPITPDFWLTVHSGWNWKARKIWMMRYPYSPFCIITFLP